jgi:uncharacterized LabA/DUF88 family protein
VGKNVAVFVDVANIFYAAKAAGVDIDYVTLLKASSAGRDLVRAYAYTGLDPDNENQRNFHDFLRRSGYKVVSKDIRKYGDGKVKANLDIELVVDMMKTARNLDIAIVVSGDGDFAPAIRAVQEQGVRVEVVSFRGNTSSDLMDVADQFTDITQVAKVEKGSSRSGRRVAADDDLSMTEVPDKQSEGTGERSRGRGRTRRTPVTVASSTPTRGRGRVAAAPAEPREAGAPALVALPGEKLSRAASVPAAELEDADLDDALDGVEVDGEGPDGADGAGELTEDGRRRRRRRGGRGRGRGRSREGVAEEGTFAARGDAERAVGSDAESDADADVDQDEAESEVAPSPARRAASSFGSVWDSQIGIQAGAPRGPVVDDDEDLEEPAIPEYLLTERRQRDAGRGRGGGAGRGRGGAYAAALDRERFGGGRGSTPSRFAEQPRREGGYNRPDRDRGGRGGGERVDRGGFRDAPRPAPRSSGDEPWSEVPPEIEAMLRAQMGSRAGGDARRPAATPRPAPEPAMTDEAPTEAEAPAPVARRGRGRSTPAAAEAAPAEGAAAAPTGRTTRTRTRKATSTPEASGAEAPTEAAPAAPKRTRTASATTRSTTRRTRTAAAPSDDAATTEASADAAPVEAAPKRRTTRRKAEPAA